MLGELKENGEAEADIAAIFTQAAEGKTDTTLERWASPSPSPSPSP